MSTNKTDRSFKTLINRRTTDQNKNYYEEFSDQTLNIHADEVWLDPINTDPVISVTAGVLEEKTLFILTEDPTVPDQQAWNGGGLKNWVSDKYGTNYGIHLYDNGDNEIFPTDDSGWFFDYQTGILTFDGDNSSHSKPYKITGYRYIGRTVSSETYGQVVCTWTYYTASLSDGETFITLPTGVMINSVDELVGIPIDAPLNRGNIRDEDGKILYEDYKELYIKVEDYSGNPVARLYTGNDVQYIHAGDTIDVTVRYRTKVRLVDITDDAFAYDNFITHDPKYPLERRFFTITDIVQSISIDSLTGASIIDIVGLYGPDPQYVYVHEPNVGDKPGIIVFDFDLINVKFRVEYTPDQFRAYSINIRDSVTKTQIYRQVDGNILEVRGLLLYDSVLSMCYMLLVVVDDAGILVVDGNLPSMVDIGILRTTTLFELNHLIHTNPSFWLPSNKSSYSYHKFPPDNIPRGVGTGGIFTEGTIESGMISLPPRSTTRIPFNASKPYRHVSMFISGVLIPLAAGAFTDVTISTIGIAADRARIFHLGDNGIIDARSTEITDKWERVYNPYVSQSRTEIIEKIKPNSNKMRVKSMMGMPKASLGPTVYGQLVINPGGQNEETVTYRADNVTIEVVLEFDWIEYEYEIKIVGNMSSQHFVGEPVISVPADWPGTNLKIGYGPLPTSIVFNQSDKSLYVGTAGDGVLVIDQHGEWYQLSTEDVNTRDGYWDGPYLDDFVTMLGLQVIKSVVSFGIEGIARIICVVENFDGAPKNDGIYNVGISKRSIYDIDGLPLSLQPQGSHGDYYRWDTKPRCMSQHTGFEMDIGRPVIIGFEDGIYAGYLASGTELPAGNTTWVDVSGNLPPSAKEINSIATSPDYPSFVAIGTADGLYMTVNMDVVDGVPAGGSAPVIWFKMIPPHGIPGGCNLAHFDAFHNYTWDPSTLGFTREPPIITFTHLLAFPAQHQVYPDYFETDPIFTANSIILLEAFDDLSVLRASLELTFDADSISTTKVIAAINEAPGSYFEAYNALVQVVLFVEPQTIIGIKYELFDDLGIDASEIPLWTLKITFTGNGSQIVNKSGTTGGGLVRANAELQMVYDVLYMEFLASGGDPIKYVDILGADTFALLLGPWPMSLYLFKNVTEVIEYTQLPHPGCNIFWRNDGTVGEPRWNLYAVNPLTISLPVKIIGDVETESIPMSYTPTAGFRFSYSDSSFYVGIEIGA